jgi:hypothetical protein
MNQALYAHMNNKRKMKKIKKEHQGLGFYIYENNEPSDPGSLVSPSGDKHKENHTKVHQNPIAGKRLG